MSAPGSTRWVAALPMYDLPELRPATDAWWAGLARHLDAAGIADVPEALTRPDDIAETWDDPRLLFGQGCGYPLTHAYRAHWQLVATPCYAAEGCQGAFYRSRLVVRADDPAAGLADLAGGVAAVNEAASHSGHIALRAAMQPHAGAGRPAFRDALLTGSHAASLAAVAEGRADVCAVDCVTYALLQQRAPRRLAGTRPLAWSPPAPGLPYIAGAAVDAAMLDAVRRALSAALADRVLAPAREALLIAGAEALTLPDYDRIHTLEADGAPAAFL